MCVFGQQTELHLRSNIYHMWEAAEGSYGTKFFQTSWVPFDQTYTFWWYFYHKFNRSFVRMEIKARRLFCVGTSWSVWLKSLSCSHKSSIQTQLPPHCTAYMQQSGHCVHRFQVLSSSIWINIAHFLLFLRHFLLLLCWQMAKSCRMRGLE